jgi:hypothetical protein
MTFKKSLIILTILLLIITGCNNNNSADDDLVPNPDDTYEEQTEEEIEEEIIIHEPELPGAFFVMIDNHPNARPQSNLDKADIVYEMVCEWTYTRYLAGFYNYDPVVVGPIRSIRYYYAQTAEAYDTVVSHVGGNMDALAYVRDKNLKSMCSITTAGGYFYVDQAKKSPHKTHVKSNEVLRFAESRNRPLKPLPELNVGDMGEGEKAAEILINYGTTQYPHQVGWAYDEEVERYIRYINGNIYKTRDDDAVYADNIVLIQAAVKSVEVPIDGLQSEINILGSGKAYFLRDGFIYSGTWEKASAKDHFVYRLDDGSLYSYTEGNVWVQQISSFDRNLSIEFEEVEG